MAKVAVDMVEKGVSQEEDRAVFVDFTELVPGKEGKRLGKTIVRYVFHAQAYLLNAANMLAYRKKDGTALYLTRDIGELLGRVSPILMQNSRSIDVTCS